MSTQAVLEISAMGGRRKQDKQDVKSWHRSNDGLRNTKGSSSPTELSQVGPRQTLHSLLIDLGSWSSP